MTYEEIKMAEDSIDRHLYDQLATIFDPVVAREVQKWKWQLLELMLDWRAEHTLFHEAREK